MIATQTPPRSELSDAARPASGEGVPRIGPAVVGPSSVETVTTSNALGTALPRRVLFMDDDARRVEVFLDRCPEAVWVKTAGACIARLSEAWDEVHLDHDLNGEQFVDVNRDDCGMAVVRWLCREPRSQLRNTRFFIHSHNLAASALMVQCLLGTGYTAEFRPFGFDLVDFLSFEEITPDQMRRTARARRMRAWRLRARVWLHRLRRFCRIGHSDRPNRGSWSGRARGGVG